MKLNWNDLKNKQQSLQSVIYEESKILWLWEVLTLSYCHPYNNMLSILGSNFNVKLQRACRKLRY
jgi:hypothetical protein